MSDDAPSLGEIPVPDDSLIAGRYRKVRAIGRGGMGVVWLCRDETLGRDVAIKQAGGLPGEDDTAHSRARREARLAASLNHPNAVAIYDVVEDHGAPWLVMEYVDAVNLSQLIKDRGRLRPEEVAPIAAQVAKALAAAHKRGIVHRDVKPSNILVDRFGIAKITDFGIAKANTDPQLTRTGMLAGTPAYFAPEVARGRTPAPPSDVWALGATIFHATEGVPPYGLDENTIALLYRIGLEAPAAPQHAGVLTPLLRHMLDPEVDSRWTMAMAADKLAEVSTGGGSVSLSSATGPTGAPGAIASAGLNEPRTEPTERVSGPQTGGQYAAAYAGPAYPVTGPQYPATAASGTGTIPPGYPPSGAVGYQPYEEPADKSRWPLVSALVAAVAVTAAAIVLVLMNQKDDSPSAAGDSETTTVSATAEPTTSDVEQPGDAFSEPPPATTTPPTTSTPPPTTTTTAPPPTTTTDDVLVEEEMANVVSTYYTLLPTNPAAAWEMLGGTLASKSYASYVDFWETVNYLDFVITDVDVQAGTVTLNIHYDLIDREIGEQTVLTLTPSGDTFLITSAEVTAKYYDDPK